MLSSQVAFGRHTREFTAILIVVVFSVALFFSIQISNGFTVLFGDKNDAIIGISILEHWRAVFEGHALWNQVSYFYPYPDSLGYNDGLLLYGIPYTIMRWIGIDPFLSAEMVNVLVRTIGCVFFYLMTRAVFGFDLYLSLLGAALFTIAGNGAVQGNHAQLFTIAFIPILFLLLFRAVQACINEQARRAIGWGISTSLFFSSWLLTAFYTAWFTAFFLILVAFTALLIVLSLGLPVRKVRPFILPVSISVMVSLISIIPFLVVYLPKARESGAHHFGEVTSYAPRVIDLLNPRLLDGRMQATVTWLQTFYPSRNVDPNGYPPLLLVLAITGGILAFLKLCRDGAARSSITAGWAAIAIATLIALLLVTHLHGWWLVYVLVPGASGIRDIARFFLVLTVPIILLALLTLRYINGWFTARAPVVVIAISVAFSLALVFEERAAYVPVALDRLAGLHLLHSIPSVPPSCTAFYVTGRSPEFPAGDQVSASIYRHNVDAMLVSAFLNVPTINGFSTFNPPDWNFANMDAPNYLKRVDRYVLQHQLQAGMCALNLSSKKWVVAPSL